MSSKERTCILHLIPQLTLLVPTFLWMEDTACLKSNHFVCLNKYLAICQRIYYQHSSIDLTTKLWYIAVICYVSQVASTISMVSPTEQYYYKKTDKHIGYHLRWEREKNRVCKVGQERVRQCPHQSNPWPKTSPLSHPSHLTEIPQNKEPQKNDLFSTVSRNFHSERHPAMVPQIKQTPSGVRRAQKL